MYYNGKGTERDLEKAFEWYLKAAESNKKSEKNPAYPYSLGRMYYNGEGTKQDLKKAMEWYANAADYGDKEAQAFLSCYDKNMVLTRQHFEKCLKLAERGKAKAQYAVGILYSQNLGVEKDFNKAYEWLSKAAAQDPKYEEEKDIVGEELGKFKEMIVNQKDYDILVSDPKYQYDESLPILKEIIRRESVYYQKHKKYTRSFEELNIKFEDIGSQEDKDDTNTVCLNSGYCYSICGCNEDCQGNSELSVARVTSEKFTEKYIDTIRKAKASGEKAEKIEEYKNRMRSAFYYLKFTIDGNYLSAVCLNSAVCDFLERYDKECDNNGNCTYKLPKSFLNGIRDLK
jgi:tetratricopeptide (TPR) repeat protein